MRICRRGQHGQRVGLGRVLHQVAGFVDDEQLRPGEVPDLAVKLISFKSLRQVELIPGLVFGWCWGNELQPCC